MEQMQEAMKNPQMQQMASVMQDQSLQEKMKQMKDDHGFAYKFAEAEVVEPPNPRWKFLKW